MNTSRLTSDQGKRPQDPTSPLFEDMLELGAFLWSRTFIEGRHRQVQEPEGTVVASHQRFASPGLRGRCPFRGVGKPCRIGLACACPSQSETACERNALLTRHRGVATPRSIRVSPPPQTPVSAHTISQTRAGRNSRGSGATLLGGRR